MQTKKREATDLQVGPHSDEEVSLLQNLGFEKLCVSDGRLRRVDGAGCDNNENLMIRAC